MCTYSNWNLVVGGYWISQLIRAKECSWAQENACSAAKDSLDNHLKWLASCITPATRLCFHSTDGARLSDDDFLSKLKCND